MTFLHVPVTILLNLQCPLASSKNRPALKLRAPFLPIYPSPLSPLQNSLLSPLRLSRLAYMPCYNEAKEVDQVEPRVLVGIGNLVVAMLPRSIAFFPYVEYSGRNTAYARMRPKRQTGRDEARRLTNKKFRTRDIDPL
jgi:hypothetical protein